MKLDQIQQDWLPIAGQNYTLEQLRDIALGAGLNAALEVTTFDRLAERARQQPFACVAQFEDERFVLFADVQDQRVLVVDPPETRWAETLVIDQKWDGSVLLLGTTPLLAESDLGRDRTPFYFIAFGCVALGICGAFALYWRLRV